MPLDRVPVPDDLMRQLSLEFGHRVAAEMGYDNDDLARSLGSFWW